MSRFVWPLQTEEGEAIALRPYDDDRIPVDLSVWETLGALNHAPPVEAMLQRREWFEKMARAFSAIPSAQPRRPLPDQCPAG